MGRFINPKTHPLNTFVERSTPLSKLKSRPCSQCKKKVPLETVESYQEPSSRTPKDHPLDTVVSRASFASDDGGGEHKESPPKQQNEKKMQVLADTLDKLIPFYSFYQTKDYNRLPKNFEPQNNEWKDFIVPSINQGTCGSCWAFSTVSCYADRFNILSRRKFFDKCLSPLTPVLCNNLTALAVENNKNMFEDVTNPFKLNRGTIANQACFGNSLVTALLYLKFYGIPTQKCMPYDTSRFYANKLQYINFGFPANQGKFTQKDLDSSKYTELSNFSGDRPSPSCFLYYSYSTQPFNFCYDNVVYNETIFYGSPAQNFTAFLVYKVNGATTDSRNIMAEIYQFGPVVTSFIVYDDFYSFNPKDGVYIHNDKSGGNQTGGHAVEIVGWGEYVDPKKPKEKPIPFWWIKNSWGTKYGYNGYFRILRGKNHCEIENNVLCFLPNLFFEYKDRQKLKLINQQIENMNIIRAVKPMDTLFKLTSKIFYSFGRYGKYLHPNTMALNYKLFGFFFFEALYNVGVTQLNTNTKSMYNTMDLVMMPGLDYGNPEIVFPFDGIFIAGKVESQQLILPQIKSIYKPRYWIYLLCLFFGFIIFCIIVYYLNSPLTRTNTGFSQN
jgi:hypothetical protein